MARALGVLDQGWVARPAASPPGTGAPDVGDVGDFISETEYPPDGARQRIIAFRADRDGAIHIMRREGVLSGYPGELGTMNLTAADVGTLGLSDLKRELAARGVTTAAPTMGPEPHLRTRLIMELSSSGFYELP